MIENILGSLAISTGQLVDSFFSNYEQNSSQDQQDSNIGDESDQFCDAT